MSSPRLRVQFETLFEYYAGQDTETQLEDVTDILCCTRRNARIVLNKMEEEGWIEWHPAAGRGKLSRLNFKRSRSDVSENLARRYLDEGKIGQALGVLENDAAKLTQVIQSYLGVQHSEGMPVVRLPYYRPLSMLNPAKSMRRSEQHIARQVFSGLTRFDENEDIRPDLAHSWEALSSHHWRFYLRPGVRFHNGELLTTDIVVDSLWRLRTLKLFSHLESVSSPGDWVVDIYLQKADQHLPLWLAETSAKITLPESSRTDDFDLLPVGTGPYRVVLNDDKRLVLQAYDGYFGFRPLLDRVEVWVIDEVHSSLVFPSLTNPIKSGRKTSFTEDVELDPGCTYLLLNRKQGVAAQDEWADYLCNKLSTLNLMRMLPEESIVEMGLLPAHGLKPGWYHRPLTNSIAVPLCGQTIRIAYHARHPMFPLLANAIEKLLHDDGLKVEFVRYEQSVVEPDSINIWIKAMGIANHRDDALAGWLLNDSDIEIMSQHDDFSYWHELIDEWREESDQPFPGREIGKSLIEKRQLVPLFHCWLGVSKDQCGALQNAKCNALGWFDFSQVWIKPDHI